MPSASGCQLHQFSGLSERDQVVAFGADGFSTECGPRVVEMSALAHRAGHVSVLSVYPEGLFEQAQGGELLVAGRGAELGKRGHTRSQTFRHCFRVIGDDGSSQLCERAKACERAVVGLGVVQQLAQASEVGQGLLQDGRNGSGAVVVERGGLGSEVAPLFGELVAWSLAGLVSDLWGQSVPQR
ncbi:hypothetical protein ACIGO9_36510 [Nocardia asteroides]|uniref:hypothetical protein n=1 Tax=Nocardia asteroides TaxID=1824 RepID=UPI0037C62518